jgi:hypothetical protein
MFRANKRHLQPHLFSDLDNLSKKQRQRLEESWAGTYRREFHNRLDERLFAVLYKDVPSRPNTPVNRLVGFETLKAGFGWSDAETYDHFMFDLQVRYAVGLDNLGEGEFDLRTVYYFRLRLCEQRQETGEDLLGQAFAQVTDEQCRAFELKTHHQRIDSTQVASNIRRMTRLQLLVEVLQRVHRMLSPADQAHYADAFAPYLKGSSGQYVYHLRGEDTAPHMQRIGELMYRLVTELALAYADHPAYQTLQRVFGEQYTVTETIVQAKPGKEISPNSLRSPDDPEATFRRKGQREYEGYVTAVTETAAAENPFQLVLKVQTAPNNTEDAVLLAEALPELKARTGVEVIYNDSGFCSPDVDAVLREQQVVQVPTELRGRAPSPDKLSLSDFEIQQAGDDPLPADADLSRVEDDQEALNGPASPVDATATELGLDTASSSTAVVDQGSTEPTDTQCLGAADEQATASSDAPMQPVTEKQGIQTTGSSTAVVDQGSAEPTDAQCPEAAGEQAPVSSDSPMQAVVEERAIQEGSTKPVTDNSCSSAQTFTEGQITCPYGQEAIIENGRNPGRYCAYFADAVCQDCPYRSKCPARSGKLDSRYRLGFSQQDIDVAQRRQRCLALRLGDTNPRSAVEATVGALKHPFSDDQLPVRGQFRMDAMMIASAAMLNVRRITRYLAAKKGGQQPGRDPNKGKNAQGESPSSFLPLLWAWLRCCLRNAGLPHPALALSC